jgi:aspartate aminotransferase
MSMYLLEDKSVVTVAGDSFGANEHVRFSYAASEKELNRAMDRLERALEKLV